MRNMIKGTVQVAALMAFTLLMNKLAGLLHLPIPGSILGIIVLFILLETRIVRLEWIDLGASWLLAELLLFFIPAAVGVMKYIPMLESDGVRILIVVIFSTFIVMASSGLLASRIAKQRERRISR
ncbi:MULTISPECIES: CidA/LrgA family holin-like protein [Paenibacillus]|uniref:Holin-like protein CidA n=1 Tax=Paenibacillus azoreducens TaxID=116718 RepID=A0A920CWH3_9BACL|nr:MULTISPECIES: CidA/LrgA family holin-like protein [Paenibacillus]MBE9914494.1 CidA/LrgA family holin-like protein [Paenibacillus donghaensis]GIO51373.1 holin-like protein CidA [Paenibacillus azoreducens]